MPLLPPERDTFSGHHMELVIFERLYLLESCARRDTYVSFHIKNVISMNHYWSNGGHVFLCKMFLSRCFQEGLLLLFWHRSKRFYSGIFSQNSMFQYHCTLILPMPAPFYLTDLYFSLFVVLSAADKMLWLGCLHIVVWTVLWSQCSTLRLHPYIDYF